jgi:HEAT repeat protein
MPASTKRGALVLWAAFGMLLCGCGGKSTADWIEQSRSKNSADRLHAIKALGNKSREAEVVAPALADALKDEDAFVRRDAAQALGELGGGAKAAVPALLVAARDRNAEVRRKAVKALKQIDAQAAANAGAR